MDKSGRAVTQIEYPAALQKEVADYNHSTLSSAQNFYLPYECERILKGALAVGAEGDAAQLATILQSTTRDDTIDGETKKRNLVAIAATLASRARMVSRKS